MKKEVDSIGVIGGGQLGMFICQSAKKFNKIVSVFTEKKDCSAKKFANNLFVGDYTNFEKIDLFLESVDLVTVETENIPLKTLEYIEKKKKLIPNSNSIKIAQNREREKKFLNSIKDIRTTKFKKINSFESLHLALNSFGKEIIIKSCEFGYDGKGQHLVNEENINKFKKFHLKNFIAEKIVPYKKEISVIVFSDKFGNIKHYPPVENLHKKNILTKTSFPAKINKYTCEKAVVLARNIIKSLKMVGLLAVEMFLLDNNEIIINEIAPRPHNSGHWTIDCCNYNQFDNLVFCILGKKIEKPEIFKSCEMINVIGKEYQKKNILNKKFKFYDYYKNSIKPKRKMGHYIITKKLT